MWNINSLLLTDFYKIKVKLPFFLEFNLIFLANMFGDN